MSFGSGTRGLGRVPLERACDSGLTSGRSCCSCRRTCRADLDRSRHARGISARMPARGGAPPRIVVHRTSGVVSRAERALCLADRRGPLTRCGARPTGPTCGSTADGPAAAATGAALRLGDRLAGPGARDADGYVYFNNDGHGCALRDAGRLRLALAVAFRWPACRSSPVTWWWIRVSARPTPKVARRPDVAGPGDPEPATSPAVQLRPDVRDRQAGRPYVVVTEPTIPSTRPSATHGCRPA